MTSFERIEREVARIAAQSDGVVGVCASHLESGRGVAYNAHERFPMASTYKLPFAVYLLACVDRGSLSLDQMVEVQPRDLRGGSGSLTTLFILPGVILSVRNLMELMLRVSDNTATDTLFRVSGGPVAVTAFLREQGIADIDLCRTIKHMQADRLGITELPSDDDWSLQRWRSLSQAAMAQPREAVLEKFDADPRDTATPAGMVNLLEQIHRSALLSEQSKQLLLDIMQRCQTGDGRLKGLLPSGTPVAHKTGTWPDGVTNDAGFITLPDGAGHIAIAVCIKSSKRETPDSERVIAQIARTVYDGLLFLE
jgi:beta-lactamase class A